MRLVLSGGGNARQCVEHHRIFASWVGQRGAILYVPGGAYPAHASLAWFHQVMAEFGSFSIRMWDPFSGEPHPHLGGVDGIFVGGGNTLALLKALRNGGFDRLMIAALTRGIAYCGGSAGAIILGRDIASCSYLDSNDVRLNDTSGFNLVQGYSICCHYEPDHYGYIKEYMGRYRADVIALTERAALCVLDGDFYSAGPDDTMVMMQNGETHRIARRITSAEGGLF